MYVWQPLFTPEQVALFEHRYQEGYNFKDTVYIFWLKINRPTVAVSISSEVTTVSLSCEFNVISSSVPSVPAATSSTDCLNELLQLPKALSNTL